MSKQFMISSKHRMAKRVLILLLSVTFIFCALHVSLQFLTYGEKQNHSLTLFEISNRFDFDDENSIPTWFSQFLLLFLAGISATIAWLQSKKSPRFFWGIIATICLIGSIDEVATLHETALQFLHIAEFAEASSTSTQNAWLIAMPLILGITIAIFIWAIRVVPRRTILLCALATGTYLFGAVVVDILTISDANATFFTSGILVAIEESMELIGMSIGAYALLNYLENTYTMKLSGTKQG